MDDATYFAAEAMSASGSKAMRRSPATFRFDRDHPRPPTPAMQAGSLVHALALTPASVRQAFSTGPDYSAVRTKDGKVPDNPAVTTEDKALAKEWRAANPNVAVVAPDDWQRAEAMAAAALAAPIPAHMLAGGWTLADLLPAAKVELPIFWQDVVSGAQCKAKPDAVAQLSDLRVACVDLKTTSSDLTDAELARTMATFGYHRQAAHYLEGLASRGVTDAEFWFLFVSTTAPHECAWKRVGHAALEVGAREMAAVKMTYANCIATGEWPTAQESGWLDGELELPRWYRGGEEG